jgi:hypothetical protein
MSGADVKRPQIFEPLRATRLMWNTSELSAFRTRQVGLKEEGAGGNGKSLTPLSKIQDQPHHPCIIPAHYPCDNDSCERRELMSHKHNVT